MKFITDKQYEVTVHFVEKDQELDMLPQDQQDYITNTLEYKANKSESYVDLGPGRSQVVLIGLGESKKVTRDSYVQAAFNAGKVLNQYKVKEASVATPVHSFLSGKELTQAIVEGFLHNAYRFNRYKSDASDSSLKTISMTANHEDIEASIKEVEFVMEGVYFARDLINTPSNDLYPTVMADKVKEFLDIPGVEVDVYNQEQIEDLGMHALLSVGQGSEKEARFLVLKYLPEGEEASAITLVGKGITYDSGGYALKPAKSMEDMKSDMSGAANVAGVIYALAKNKVTKNVVGVMGLVENLISGSSYKNGDIIPTMKGTTIEVLNTDAEGRVTLADTLYYAATKVNSKEIIDLATLTGACLVALGEQVTGAMTNNEELYKALEKSANYTGEMIWQLPMTDQLREQVKGTVGDLKNACGPYGGTITAGIFLEHFVEGIPWVHLDIAGPAFYSSAYGYIPSGGTGIPVRTLYHYISNAE